MAGLIFGTVRHRVRGLGLVEAVVGSQLNTLCSKEMDWERFEDKCCLLRPFWPFLFAVIYNASAVLMLPGNGLNVFFLDLSATLFSLFGSIVALDK